MDASSYLVANGLPVVVDLLVKQLKQSRRVELEVLDIRLFRGSRGLYKHNT